jgi:hypothetical protein
MDGAVWVVQFTPALSGGVRMKILILCFSSLLIGVAQAEAQAISISNPSSGLGMSLQYSTAVSPALLSVINNQGCIPKGALSDGTLYATVRLSGAMNAGSEARVRVNVCDDALVLDSNGTYLANIQVEVDTTSLNGVPISRKNNLTVTLQRPDLSFVTMGYWYYYGASWIHIKSRELYGDSARQWFPIKQGGVYEVVIRNDTSAAIRVDNVGSHVDLMSSPAYSGR